MMIKQVDYYGQAPNHQFYSSNSRTLLLTSTTISHCYASSLQSLDLLSLPFWSVSPTIPLKNGYKRALKAVKYYNKVSCIFQQKCA